MKLFIWTGFQPDYTDGLAFALADDEDEARDLVVAQKSSSDGVRWHEDEITWGIMEVRDVEPCARCVSGGS